MGRAAVAHQKLSPMIYLFSVLAGIAGGLVGYVVGAAIGLAANTIFSVSNFEGGSGYLVVFVYGPLGSLVGLALGVGLMLSGRSGGRAEFAEVGIHSAIALAAVVAIAGAAVGLLYLNRPQLNPNGPPPQLEFEIRFAQGVSPPAPASIRVDLDTPENQMPASIDDRTRRDNERSVITGSVALHHRTAHRTLALKMQAQPVWLFSVQLAAKPEYSTAFGEWRLANFIDELTPGGQPRKPGALENHEIRYRVRDPLKAEGP
jgi:hypothetical protein